MLCFVHWYLVFGLYTDVSFSYFWNGISGIFCFVFKNLSEKVDLY